MPHIKDRLCLVPFCDLTDSPGEKHHAIGSPYFNKAGLPMYPDPVVIAVRADIVDKALPRSSTLAVSCNTRPYQSYGPVIRRVFECSEPNLHPELRRGMEGVMELGEVRALPPGGLHEQVNQILLACVATMTAGTNDTVLQQVMDNIVGHFRMMVPGSTIRIPLIGTGKARTEKATEDVFREVIDLTLSNILQALFPENPHHPPRRALLVHPSDYEAKLIMSVLTQRSIFLTILDKMGLATTDKRYIYGIAHGDQEKHQLVQADTFEEALGHFDQSLEYLLKGKSRESLKEAARGAEVEPALGGMYLYIHFLATKQRGLLEAVTNEALDLASRGRIEDAYSVGRTLTSLGGEETERRFIHALRRCYAGYNLAELEAQLFYEKYMQAEQSLQQMRENLPTATAITGEVPAISEDGGMEEPAPEDKVLMELQSIEAHIPQKTVQNAFHVAIRKFLADPIKTLGVRRVLESLDEFKQHHGLPLSESEETISKALLKLADEVDRDQNEIPQHQLHRKVLEQLSQHLGHHTTYRLEEARFHLRGSGRQMVSRDDIAASWKHLEAGFAQDTRDYGILSYVGFLILMQGPKILHLAETFYLLWAKLIEQELSSGRFRLHRLESPQGKKVTVPMQYPHAQKAHSYHERWQEHVQDMAELVKGLLSDHNGEVLLNKYNKTIQDLGEIGRYDLAQLYDQYLGEKWISLMVSRKRGGTKIPIPMVGEISLDMVINMYRRFRRWMMFRKLHNQSVEEAMKDLLQKMGSSFTSTANQT